MNYRKNDPRDKGCREVSFPQFESAARQRREHYFREGRIDKWNRRRMCIFCYAIQEARTPRGKRPQWVFQ